MADYPKLLYFTLEERNKGLALVAKMCDAVGCEKPLGYVAIGGLLLSGKHEKDRDGVHSAPLTPNDLRRLADLIEYLQSKCSTIEAQSERAA